MQAPARPVAARLVPLRARSRLGCTAIAAPKTRPFGVASRRRGHLGGVLGICRSSTGNKQETDAAKQRPNSAGGDPDPEDEEPLVEKIVDLMTPKEAFDFQDLFLMSASFFVLIWFSMELYRVYAQIFEMSGALTLRETLNAMARRL